MQTKYITHDPMTGVNTEHDSYEEAIEAFKASVAEQARRLWHGRALTKVLIDDEGNKTYMDAEGAEIDKQMFEDIMSRIE